MHAPPSIPAPSYHSHHHDIFVIALVNNLLRSHSLDVLLYATADILMRRASVSVSLSPCSRVGCTNLVQVLFELYVQNHALVHEYVFNFRQHIKIGCEPQILLHLHKYSDAGILVRRIVATTDQWAY